MSEQGLARELAAWFRSGNSVPVDEKYLLRMKWERIKKDIDALTNAVLTRDNNHE
jgi:hypothetical protein